MICLKGVQKFYSFDKERVEVLKSIDLQIKTGEFVGVIGESGSGKSTLVNILGFIDKQFDGEYWFENTLVTYKEDNKLSRIRNQNVGFVFQNFGLIENRTIQENVDLPLLYSGMTSKKARVQVKKMIESIGLKEKANRYPKQLSGGQQQRVAIARAIIHQPKFLIADEPTGSLDSKTSLEIMDIFQTLHKNGTTIILVTHNRELLHYCTKVIEIQDGKIKEQNEI